MSLCCATQALPLQYLWEPHAPAAHPSDTSPTVLLQLSVESLSRRGLLLRKPTPCVVVHACVQPRSKGPPPFAAPHANAVPHAVVLEMLGHATGGDGSGQRSGSVTAAPLRKQSSSSGAVASPQAATFKSASPDWPVWLGGDGCPAVKDGWREIGRTEFISQQTSTNFTIAIPVTMQPGDLVESVTSPSATS